MVSKTLSHVLHAVVVAIMALSMITVAISPTAAVAATIPTTTNPTGNGSPGVRIIANPSFEDFDNSGRSDGMICEEDMNGWLSTHPNNASGITCPPFELWTYPFMNNVANRAAPDGTHAIELNAYDASMAY